MREIRFRAWYPFNKQEKKEIDEMGDGSSLGNMFYSADYQFKFIGKVITIEEQYKSPSYIMQFTGLKDKNGKEIYEGDILICEGLPNKEPVEWYRGCPFVSGTPLSDVDEDLVEVIGNIYENPELIKSRTEPKL